MRIIQVSFFIITMMLLSFDGEAQRFKAGAIFGINAAQIDGDNAVGYNKLGFETGLRAVTILSDKAELSIEMVLSQRGSQGSIGGGNSSVLTNVRLNYISIPVIFNLGDWLSDDEYYYRLNFSAGLSYGRLIGYKLSEDLILLDGFLNENDVSWIAGATYYTNKNLGFTIRYNRFINLLFKTTTVNAESLRSYYLNFHTVYMF